jgi:heptosyltransferase-3
MSTRGNIKLKLVDRYIGIFLIFFLSFFKIKKIKPQQYDSLGILATAAIGDTILLSALAQSLKSKYPQAKIILFAGESNVAIAQLLVGFDEIVLITVKNPWKAILQLRKYSLDLLIDSGQWARINALLSFFAKSKHTVGFKTEGQYRHFLYDSVITHSSTHHELENFLNLNLDFALEKPIIPMFKTHSVDKVNHRIICHIKPSGEKAWMKEWDNSKWIKLIHYLEGRGFEVFLTGGPEDQTSLNELFNQGLSSKNVYVVAGKYSLKQTMELIQSAKLCISVNTGIMHMASVLGIDLVAIHGPTNPKRWGPINSNSTIIQSSLTCSPCLNLGFDYKCPVNDCMKEISYEKVLEEVKKYLT